MTHTLGRNLNTNPEAELSDAITLNATTSTIVAVAQPGPDPVRINFTFSNPSSKVVWLKFQEASLDDDKKGIIVYPRTVYEMPVDNIYEGEISAIAESGTPDVYYTQY